MKKDNEITVIPVDSVRVANPRVRDRRKFELIVRSIAEQGLKRPITVTEADSTEGSVIRYDLVCGQGRLEAFISLGEKSIPAVIKRISKSDSLIASIVENIARRRVPAIDQIKMIQWMNQQGNSLEDISRKTGLAEKYLYGIIKLIKEGEDRVLDAVLHGRLPITVAVQIAGVTDEEAQKLLLEAYERREMKRSSLSTFRRLLDQRKSMGKSYGSYSRSQIRRKGTADGLIVAYKQETQRQKLMVRKARTCESRLLSIAAAFRELLGDDDFTTLLRAEEIDSLPRILAERMKIT